MYTIQLNEKGSRHLEVSASHFETIRRFALFRDLIDSTGYVTDATLEKLKLNLRALAASLNDDEEMRALLDLCYNVIYHDYMKAYGLRNLMVSFAEWEKTQSID